jgi:hypothetical protein
VVLVIGPRGRSCCPGGLSDALEQIDEKVYEAYEQVEDDPEDLHKIMWATSSRAPTPPSTKARTSITAMINISLTSAHLLLIY